MNKRKRLGRGLEALLSATGESAPSGESTAEGSTSTIAASNEASPSGEPRIIPMRSGGDPGHGSSQHGANQFSSDPDVPESERILKLKVHEIDDNPFQPRRDFSEPEIVSLAESLKEHDMLQPVLVRRIDDRFQLISGERRLRAAIRAGWTTIPAQLRVADDRLVAELAIVENLQRKDLNAIEKALSFRRYLDQHESSQEELAQRLKIDRSTIANLIRLLELPEIVQQSVRTSVISAGHARALLPLGEESLQLEFCKRIQVEGWSVRECERQVSEYLRGEGGEEALKNNPNRRTTSRTSTPQIASLEQEMRMALGTKVEIRKSSRGKGRIVLHFTSVDEFERLRSAICESVLQSQSRAAG